MITSLPLEFTTDFALLSLMLPLFFTGWIQQPHEMPHLTGCERTHRPAVCLASPWTVPITLMASHLMMATCRVTTIAVRTYTKVGVTRIQRNALSRVNRVRFQQVTPLFVQQRVAWNQNVCGTASEMSSAVTRPKYAISAVAL